MDYVRKNIHLLEATCFAMWGALFGLLVSIGTGSNPGFGVMLGVVQSCHHNR